PSLHPCRPTRHCLTTRAVAACVPCSSQATTPNPRFSTHTIPYAHRPTGISRLSWWTTRAACLWKTTCVHILLYAPALSETRETGGHTGAGTLPLTWRGEPTS